MLRRVDGGACTSSKGKSSTRMWFRDPLLNLMHGDALAPSVEVKTTNGSYMAPTRTATALACAACSPRVRCAGSTASARGSKQCKTRAVYCIAPKQLHLPWVLIRSLWVSWLRRWVSRGHYRPSLGRSEPHSCVLCRPKVVWIAGFVHLHLMAMYCR